MQTDHPGSCPHPGSLSPTPRSWLLEWSLRRWEQGWGGGKAKPTSVRCGCEEGGDGVHKDMGDSDLGCQLDTLHQSVKVIKHNDSRW